jgi:hypothetical protein
VRLEYCARLLDCWVLCAADAAGLLLTLEYCIRLLDYWVLGAADAARLL